MTRIGGDAMKHAVLTEKIIGVFFEVYNELGDRTRIGASIPFSASE